ncbi:protein maelstrom homolog [Lasioglossum baleicum]|uniref:protein maelstrom homolog n=1 Tax=Lasioglossum baleicum TaxID=434251 RepID=UPI003FCCE734
MPKNNKGKNAFHFFMIDWKKQEEKLGKSFPDGLRDVQKDPKIQDDWKDLSVERRAYYQSLAKDSKIKAQGTMEKRTALGESINEINLRLKKEQEFQQNMLEYIQDVISIGKKHNSLEKLKFMFIHVNWFYKRDVGINRYDFCPAEFAVAEFSLDGGTENVYHEIISTTIPIGWRSDALEMSKETHKIPIEHEDGQSDFNYMYRKLVKLLKSNMTGDKYPPLFTIKDMAPVVESLLRRMCDASGGRTDDFLIYSLEALFGGLRNAAAENVNSGSIPLVVAEDQFGKDYFSYNSGLECEFHKIFDAPLHCSMSIVKRWGYTICDHCCEYLDIEMIEGVHRPMPSASYNTTRQDPVDIQLSQLSLNETGKKPVSMSGVGADYREKVSARSHKEEERRRNQSKPLDIVDHSIPNIPGRPLRPPKTVAKAVSDFTNNLDENFPPIRGRGAAVNRNNIADMNFPPLGRGRGKYVQK